MTPKHAIRWVLILLLGGYGLYELFQCMGDVWTASQHGWLRFGHALVLTTIVSATFFLPVFLLYRRQYRRLVIFLSAIAAFFLFGAVLWLMRHFGLHALLSEFISSTAHSSLDPVRKLPILLLGVVASLLTLVGPFILVLLFLRTVVRITERYADHDGSKPA